jgi:hypothetical protein
MRRPGDLFARLPPTLVEVIAVLVTVAACAALLAIAPLPDVPQ